MLDACINFRKKLRNRYLLHRGDADDLQNLPKAVWQMQTPFGDGHEKVEPVPFFGFLETGISYFAKVRR